MYNYFMIIGKFKKYNEETREATLELLPDFPNQYGERIPYELVVCIPEMLNSLFIDNDFTNKRLGVKGRMVPHATWCALYAERIMFLGEK